MSSPTDGITTFVRSDDHHYVYMLTATWLDWHDAVFYLQAGATLRNVIIGKDQAEGVHCYGPCTLEYVWFEDVCEDAISVKGDSAGDESWIIGGGAYHADDKVVQHNGCGTVNIIKSGPLAFSTPISVGY